MPRSEGPRRRRMHPELLRKLHSFTGLFPLGAYLLFHAYEGLAARGGRAQAVLRLERTTHAPLEVVCLLLPLLLHAALGVRLARLPARAVEDDDASVPYASANFRRLQLWTGVLSAGFLLWHLAGVWVPRVVAGRPAIGYGALVDHAATLPRATLYVIGTSAVCVHFAQGLSAVCLRYHILPFAPRTVRFLFAALVFLLWATLIDALSAYVGGKPLL
jgi:succinate dehydrogenase / fumarate reductase cytochrome b subunit